MVVASDVIEGHRAGFFVRLHANIWLYLVVTDQGKGTCSTTCYVFDSRVVELKVKEIATFGGKSLEATIEKLLPAIRSVYEFDSTSNNWKMSNVCYPVQSQQVEGTQHP